MKVAIISDIHDNIPNLDKVLRCIKKDKEIETVFCCGDFGSEDTLAYLVNNFEGKVYTVLGNMDEGYVEFSKIKDKYDNLIIEKDYNQFSLENKKILLVHQPHKYKDYLAKDDLDYIFYGHTHKPWEEKINNITALNPGNVANQIYAPSFAIWDLDKDKFELIQINLLD